MNKLFLLITALLLIFVLSSCDPKIAKRGKRYLNMRFYRFEELDGVKIAYQELQDPSNPALVMIHGLMGNPTNFEKLFPHLSENFHLLVVDLPGFGLSDKQISKPLSRRYMAWVVGELLEKKGIEKYHVLRGRGVFDLSEQFDLCDG
ncbi:MAG: Alpha/beta hydrolase fold protein [Thermotoga sp. 50_1627]|uniref:alpha/beta fold hydrolase n=1 Tax=Pseudothermotoga sp. TaxID=2033661 RepID=UPI00076D8A89|nr:MAG: Alpha/beta hydrolase fold protein [Thermotoga sp. 50_1627]MBC7117209.1 alpha/beta fold hydrolase [Pseudothermotoga sp.]MDK2923860.1 hypothetical protein [Pseudothermotoga sp.]HBT39509.1 hypothetical protein [Pseudothermotoga sp.]HCO97414.1 hypothetical protein [Pseudothermotoga sp.]